MRREYIGTTAERGTVSLPTDAVGAKFWDTDESALYIWDGSAWVEVGAGEGGAPMVMFAPSQSFPWNISTTLDPAFSASLGIEGAIKSWRQCVYLSGTHDATHYWSIALQVLTNPVSGTWTTVATLTTASGTTGQWQILSNTSLSYALTTGYPVAKIAATKVNSPGNLWLACPEVYVS